MGVEIERKFLIERDLFTPSGEGVLIRQGYLSLEGAFILRVRTKGEKAFLTLKEQKEGIARLEYEYEIPLADAKELFLHVVLPVIEKRRYHEEYAGHIFEVDEFFGENEGLIVAEIELEEQDEPFQNPPWLREEVSDDARYYNLNLAKNPYKEWKNSPTTP